MTFSEMNYVSDMLRNNSVPEVKAQVVFIQLVNWVNCQY